MQIHWQNLSWVDVGPFLVFIIAFDVCILYVSLHKHGLAPESPLGIWQICDLCIALGFFFFFLWGGGCCWGECLGSYSGPCTCQASGLPLEPPALAFETGKL